MISRSWLETSHVNVVHRLALQPNFNLITNHYFNYINAFTLVHLSVFEFASIYIFNVSPFTLMKGTGVPENYVF